MIELVAYEHAPFCHRGSGPGCGCRGHRKVYLRDGGGLLSITRDGRVIWRRR